MSLILNNQMTATEVSSMDLNSFIKFVVMLLFSLQFLMNAVSEISKALVNGFLLLPGCFLNNF